MKTIQTLVVAVVLFFLSFGAPASLAQESAEGKVPPSPSTITAPLPGAKTECTTPVISFFSLKKLTEPLKDEVRVDVINKILDVVKNQKNKRVPALQQITQGDPLSNTYYEISGDLSGRKLTVQHIPSIDGKSIGNISLTWDEKDEKSGAIQNWFVSLFLDGSVETALDPAKDKLMVTSGGKVEVGAEHRQFWQTQADQILNELHEKLRIFGSLK